MLESNRTKYFRKPAKWLYYDEIRVIHTDFTGNVCQISHLSRGHGVTWYLTLIKTS